MNILSHIEDFITEEHADKLHQLCEMMRHERLFALATGPYPVSHGEEHINRVMRRVRILIDAIGYDRFPEGLEKNKREGIYELSAATILHDIAMAEVTTLTQNGDIVQRQMHASIQRLMEYFERVGMHTYISRNYLYNSTIIAWAHAGDKEFSADEKLNWIDKTFTKLADCIHLPLCARILRIADLFDVGPERLNPTINKAELRDDQIKHYEMNRLVKVIIGDSRVDLVLAEPKLGCVPKTTAYTIIEIKKLRKNLEDQIFGLKKWLEWSFSDNLNIESWEIEDEENLYGEITQADPSSVLASKEIKTNTHILFPCQSNADFGDYKIKETRGYEFLGQPLEQCESCKNSIPFSVAKKKADSIIRDCSNNAMLIYATDLSYDVFSRHNGRPYIKSICWVLLYRRNIEYYLIHINNNLHAPNIYTWRMDDRDFNAQFITIACDNITIDSDLAYIRAEESGAFLDRGNIILFTQKFRQVASVCWLYKGYFIDAIGGNILTDPINEALSDGIIMETNINNERRYVYFQDITNHQQNIKYKAQIDFKTRVVLAYEFENILNYFDYNFFGKIASGIPIRCVAKNKNDNKKLAEREVINIDCNVIDCIEKHFNNYGKEIYRSKVKICANFGITLDEEKLSGEKISDYFKIWPIGKCH